MDASAKLVALALIASTAGFLVGRAVFGSNRTSITSSAALPRDSCAQGTWAPARDESLPAPNPPASRGATRNEVVKTFVALLGDVDKAEYHHRRQWYLQGLIQPFMVWFLTQQQHAAGVHGSVGEIGVHYGGFFLAIAAASAPAERLFAVDIFDNQQLNVDGSGKAVFKKFEENVKLLGFGTAELGQKKTKRKPWQNGRPVHYIKDASTSVDGPAFAQLAGQPVRMMSVDGGHTREATCHDINLADSFLHDGGIVIVDDLGCCDKQASWSLGVIDGVASYFSTRSNRTQPRRLEPFFFAAPKLYLAAKPFAQRYRAALRSDRVINQLFNLDGGSTDGNAGGAPMHPSRYTMFGGQILRPAERPKESAIKALWLERLNA